MTEHKRVALTTVAPTKIEKKKEKKAKCLRISLRLPESNEKSCPEFNYRELVAHSLSERFKKKQDAKSGNKPLGNVINTPMLDPTDPFARDEDEALKLLATQLEKKYGNYGSAKKKKKRKKENDFSTLGEGYDDTDPFIDNSDAIDEVIATNVETRHRGFYINSGELELDEVAELEEGEESEGEILKKKKKSNRIESESEDDDDSGDEEQSKKRKNSSENGIDKHKKRKLDEGEMLRKRKKMIDRMNAQKEHKDHSDGEKVANGTDSKAYDKSIADSIESVIAKVREGGELKISEDDDDSNSSTGSTSSSSDSDSSNSSSSKDSDSEDENEDDERGVDGEDSQERLSGVENGHLHPENGQDAPLPDDLPQELLVVISRLKDEGKRCNTTSQKFFTDTVNKILQSIEIRLMKIGGRKRSQIYNHLAQHCPCGAQTLIKRAKNLLAEKNDNKLREPMRRLQDAVEKSMPAMLETYNQMCKKALAERSLENGLAEKEEEGSQDGEKKKVSRPPKKKYTFTNEIRQLLCNVVQVRVSAWQIVKKRSETPEEHIKGFLDTEVRTLWPKGWVNAKILFKESIDAHAPLTDAMHAKAIAAKRLSMLGGSSSPVTVPRKDVHSPKPSIAANNTPMPSPTAATVNPVNTANNTQQSQGTTLFKPIMSTTQTIPKSSLVAPKPHKVQHSVSNISKPKLDIIPKTVGLSNDSFLNSGLSIRSVENLNDVPSKSNTQTNNMPLNLSEKLHSNLSEKIKNKRVSSDVIDLSSDDERSHKSKTATSVINNVDKDSKSNTEKDLSNKNGDHPIKDDNLDEEMDSVMNEILNISKNYSPDRSSVSNIKESSNTVIVTSSIKSNQNQTQLPQNQPPVIIKTTQNSISSTSQQSMQHQISTMSKSTSSPIQPTIPLPKFVSSIQHSSNKISAMPKPGVISVAPWSKMESNKNPKATASSSSNITWSTSSVQDQSGKGSKPAELLPIGGSSTISMTSNSSSSSGMLGNSRASISIVKSSNDNSTLVKDAAGKQNATKQKVTQQNLSSVHSGMTQEQIQQYKQQLQQQQKQKELWQQNLLSNMGQMSNNEMYTLMAQMGYQQSQTGTGQNPGKL